jgi:hypothetical protein
MLASVVDDSLVAFERLSTFEDLQRDFVRLKVKVDCSDVCKFSGMYIDYDRAKGILRISQQPLIEVGALRFGINDQSRIVPSPMDEKFVVSRDDCPIEHASELTVSKMRSVIGTEGYISNCSRPGLKFSVAALSRVADNPSPEHLKSALRGMTYAYQTRKIPIIFANKDWHGPDGRLFKKGVPVSWADSSLANSGYSELRRSHGGFAILINGAAFSMRSGLQKTTADSSAKAECVEVYNCARELVYNFSLFARLDIPLTEPIVLFEDNSAAISIMDMSSNSSQSRHFEIKYFYVKEVMDEGYLTLVKCPTLLMLADGMTKALPPKRFAFVQYWLQGLHALSDSELAAIGIDARPSPV